MRHLCSSGSVVWRRFLIAMLCASGSLSGESLTANDRQGQAAAANGAAGSIGSAELKQVLEREATGQAINRQQALASDGVPDESAQAWQAGYFKLNDQWMAIDRLTADLANGNANHQRYLAKREELAGDPEQHLKLAQWCADHDLADQARAHYFAVLATDPNCLAARKYLGHVQLDGQWIALQQWKSQQSDARQTLDQLDAWMPKLAQIFRKLRANKSGKTNAALDELDRVDTQAALPALVLMATQVDDDLALPVVRKIAHTKSRETCEALVHIALVHPSPDVRRVSVQAIREYPEAFYVPSLLSLLTGEMEVENQLVLNPQGHVSMMTVFKKELQDKKQHQTFQKSVSVASSFSSVRRQVVHDVVSGPNYAWSIVRSIPKSNPVALGEEARTVSSSASQAAAAAVYVPQEVLQSVAGDLKRQGEEQKYLVDRQNRAAAEHMSPVFALLRDTTGENLANDPRVWWSWWNDRNERYQPPKPTIKTYNEQREQLVVSTHVRREQQFNRRVYADKVLTQFSCLVPGTLIQTAQGLMPVEKINVGDMVLSKDAESGELALKPVMLTTVRPPKSTIKIVTAKNTIQATGGHLWWVSGLGWTKSRDLKPDMHLHTATGNVCIQEIIEDTTEVPTHNLVIEDFHTYFVGPESVLSYDNTPVKPTLRKVPGLN